jgi:cation transporter-like permease
VLKQALYALAVTPFPTTTATAFAALIAIAKMVTPAATQVAMSVTVMPLFAASVTAMAAFEQFTEHRFNP